MAQDCIRVWLILFFVMWKVNMKICHIIQRFVGYLSWAWEINHCTLKVGEQDRLTLKELNYFRIRFLVYITEGLFHLNIQLHRKKMQDTSKFCLYPFHFFSFSGDKAEPSNGTACICPSWSEVDGLHAACRGKISWIILALSETDDSLSHLWQTFLPQCTNENCNHNVLKIECY